MWKVVFTKQAAKDAKKLKAAGLDKKAKELVDVVRENPLANPPDYEAFVGNLSGYYSRRISIQRRFVYTLVQGELVDDGALRRHCESRQDVDALRKAVGCESRVARG